MVHVAQQLTGYFEKAAQAGHESSGIPATVAIQQLAFTATLPVDVDILF